MNQNSVQAPFSFKQFFTPLTTKKAIVFIIIIGLIVYFNSLFNRFIGDDFSQIVNNDAIHSLGNISLFFSNSTFSNGAEGSNGLMGVYYKPLLSTIFSLIYSIFGNWSPAFHMFQLGMHIGNCILLFLIFKKLLKKDIAFIISLIFLVHPINNESIVNISALQEPLFLFFGLLALKFTQQEKYTIYSKIATVFFLICSLLTKETGVIFLFIVPLYRKIFYRQWKLSTILSTIAFSLYFSLRIFVAHIFLKTVQTTPFMELTLVEKLINIPAIIFFYLKTFMYPKDLIINQRWIINSITISNFYIPLATDAIFFIVAILLAVIIYRRERQLFNFYIFFLIWFILGLSMHLQIISLDFTVSDRWFYFPLIGLLGMIGVTYESLRFKNKYTLWIYCIALTSVLVVYSARDIIRNFNWKDALTLYKHDIVYYPNDYVFQNALGLEFLNSGDLPKATSHILYSIRLHPTSESWTILGLIYTKSNKTENAEVAFNNALAINDNFYTYVFLAKIMMLNDDPQKTIIFLNKFVSRFPNNAVPWEYLGIEKYKLGLKEEAISAIQKSLLISSSPETINIYNIMLHNEKINLVSP